jgi:hypothetical protein
VGEVPGFGDGYRSVGVSSYKWQVRNLKLVTEISEVIMAEAVQEKLRVTSPESRVTSFEPEILAFCCEH